MAICRCLRTAPLPRRHQWFAPVSGSSPLLRLMLVEYRGSDDDVSVAVDLDARLQDAQPLQAQLAASVEDVQVETWIYRPELSLLPEPRE